MLKNGRKPRVRLLLVPLLLVSAFTFLAPSIITVHASGPATDGNCTQFQTSGSTIACTLTTTSTNDGVFVLVHIVNPFGGGTAIHVSTIVGGGLTFVLRAQIVDAPNVEATEEWYANAAATVVAQTITVTMSGNIVNAAGNVVRIAVYGISGLQYPIAFDANAAVPATAKGTITTGNFGTTISTSNSNDYLILACSLMEGNSQTLVVNSPFTVGPYGNGQLDATHGSYSEGNDNVVATQSGLSTQCARTIGSGTVDWNMIVDAPIVVSPLVIITVIGPCNFFQLQCWAFPMMFMGMFMGFFIGVATTFSVSEKSFMYLLLTGATFTSLVEIQMGIMTPMVPVLLVASNIAYSFRLDRLIQGAITRSGKK